MSDPANWAGHDPDVLGSLANERNGLAWQRTALSWVASGATVTRYFSGNGLLTARATIGYLMLAVGALVWFDGVRRYHRQSDSIRADEPTKLSETTIRTVGYATTAVIAIIIAIELAAF